MNPTSEATLPAAKGVKEPVSAGMWQVMAMLLLNLMAVQKYANEGLAPAVQKMNELNLKLSDDWLDIMQNTDLKKLNYDLTHGSNSTKGYRINADTAKLNLHSTLYNQTSTFFSGLTQAGQTNMGNTNDVTGLIIKMYQEGPLSILANLFR